MSVLLVMQVISYKTNVTNYMCNLLVCISTDLPHFSYECGRSELCCLRVPRLHLCVRQPACVGRYHAPVTECNACAGSLCLNALHLFARVFAVPARVLSRVCFIGFSSIAATTIGGGLPLSSWARGIDTYDWRAVPSTLVDFVLTASFCMHRRDSPPIPSPTQHPYMYDPPPHSHTFHTACQRT